jgi:Flp pilus assembly protein TadG
LSVRASIKSLRDSEDGQSLVELALVLPLLLFVVFALIDFGLAINQYNDTTNLSNLGARAVTVLGTSGTQPACTTSGGTASTSLVTYLRCQGAQDSGTLGGANLTVCTFDSTNPGTSWQVGDTIQVKVHAPYNWTQIFMPGVGKVGFATSTISSTATMRAEQALSNTSSNYTWINPSSSSTTFSSC